MQFLTSFITATQCCTRHCVFFLALYFGPQNKATNPVKEYRKEGNLAKRLSRKERFAVVQQQAEMDAQRERLAQIRQRNAEIFADKNNSDGIHQIYDPRNGSLTKSSQTYTKENLRSYLDNVYSNAQNLRNMSRYLKMRSAIYNKIIWDNASMIDTNYRQVIYPMDLTKEPDFDKINKSRYETSKMLDTMNLPSEMLKVYLECWTVDVFFGCYFYFEDEGGFMFPLDPDYCMITAQYSTGDFAFSLNCDWLSQYDEETIELWGEPFTTLYKNYQNDRREYQWQPFPDEYACCMKVNLDEWRFSIPPLLPLFNSLIDLEDLKDVQATQNENLIYKILDFELPLMANAKLPDDFAIDVDTAIRYFNKAVEGLPPNIGALISPMKINPINFPDDAATDVNKVENASYNILKTAGHSAFTYTTGTTAVTAQLKADEDFAISSLLPQTQGWINRMVSYHVSDPSKVKMMEVTKNTREAFKDSLIRDMNYGSPMLSALGTLNGFSEYEQICMAYGQEAAELRSLWYPYATAATQGAHSYQDKDQDGLPDKGGRPSNETPTDESEASADKRERNK